MKKRSIILIIMLLTIGFASVSVSLIINGTIAFGTNESDFDVIFTEATIDGIESSNAVISGDKRKITFSTNKLTSIGESSKLEYKLKNNSTQYGANVTINCTNVLSEYIEVSSKLDGKTIPIEKPIIIDAQEVKFGYISAKLIKAYAGPDTSIELTCEIIATPTEKENTIDYQPSRYRENILNGADPVLASNLVPVTLADDGKVTYADIDEEWYNYENKKWANAVLLEDNKTYNVGEIIPESAIEAYFVWIPRYKYKIFDEGNYIEKINEIPAENIAKEIQIEFEGKDIAPSNGHSIETWLTHPAFTNLDVNGLWVGKFEVGYKGASSRQEAQNLSIDANKVIVKPSVYSWTNNKLSNFFKIAYNYKRELDSHMMKNTEWGAVAYLSHSKYGTNKEININNNSNYMTGYSSVEGIDQSTFPGTSGIDQTITLPYNTETGYKATTTGNITGIYDMSGGTNEYVAAYMDGWGIQNDGPTKSGFTESDLIQYNRYFDKYSNDCNSEQTSWNNRILGDATGEMGPFYYYENKSGSMSNHNNWYGDSAGFVRSGAPWFFRGGSNVGGLVAGQFTFGAVNGKEDPDLGARIVLTP